MIIKNKEILSQYWNSNKPAGYMDMLLNVGLNVEFLKKNTTCVGFIVAKDLETKEVNIYIGMGLGKDEKEDIEFILELGKKIKKEGVEDLIKVLNK